MEFDAPDADTATAHAYVECRTDDGNDDEVTAGVLLPAVLADLSIQSRRDGHLSAGSTWISVPVDADGYILISGSGEMENEIGYAPAEHHGWCVVCDSDSGDVPEPVVLHDGSGCRDIWADTAAVVETMRRLLADAR